jgi:Kdo2-lipid IVA lauroyltransferase/acyltransferase
MLQDFHLRIMGFNYKVSRNVKIKYQLEYRLLRGAIFLINLLPLPVIMALTQSIGWLVWVICPFRLPVTYSNLSTVFPDMEHPEKIRLLRNVYLQFIRTFGLIAILHRKRIFRMIQGAEISGREKLENALSQGKGVILTTFHGCWFEAYFAWFNSNNLPVSLVYQQQSNPLSDAYFIRQRQRYGKSLEHVHSQVGMRYYQEALGRNRILILSLDQNFNTGTVIPFFNRPHYCAKGAAILHLRTKAPVMTSVYYVKNRKLHIDFEDVPLPGYEQINEDNIRDISATSIRGYESFIREYPEQWFNLFHKLWSKTDYPERVPRTFRQVFF